MSVIYRGHRPEEEHQRWWAHRAGFGDSTADAEIARRMALPTSYQPAYTLVAEVDAAIAAQVTTLPFTMRWSGHDIACGGVTAVSTLPTHRRQGHVRELMCRSFARMRDQGQPVAMLWASMAAIYQRFGYGIAFTNRISRFDPRTLRFAASIATPGRTRMVRSSEAAPVLSPVYMRFAAPRTLMLHRTPHVWEMSILALHREGAPLLVATYEEAGEVLGYCIYEVEDQRRDEPGPDQRITVREFVWLTPAAHRALIHHLIGYDLAFEVRIWRVPFDDPLFHHTQEPRLLRLHAEDGTLLRIVDVAAALAGRGYDADGRLRFALADELCPWNSGVWELAVEGGSARVTTCAAETKLTLTPRALAIIASGHQPASWLARGGMISGAGGQALATADALFRTSFAPFCADPF